MTPQEILIGQNDVTKNQVSINMGVGVTSWKIDDVDTKIMKLSNKFKDSLWSSFQQGNLDTMFPTNIISFILADAEQQRAVFRN